MKKIIAILTLIISITAQATESTDFIVVFKNELIHNSFISVDDEEYVRIPYGANKLKFLSESYDVEISHVKSMSLGADLIRVDDIDIEAESFREKLLDSGEFSDVIVDLPIKAIEYNDPSFTKQNYFYERSNENKSGQGFLKMREGLENNLGRKLRIGVVDSGYAPHEDMEEVTEGYDFHSSRHINSDILAEERDSIAEDSALLENGSLCHNGHGLAVSGLIAAKSNNGIGIVGAMDSEMVNIIHARVLDCTGWGKISDLLDAISWLVGESVSGIPDIENRVDFINLSLTGYSLNGCSDYEQSVYTNARKKGVVVFAGAGNSYTDAKNYIPASCNNVISVAASDDNGDKADFSNYGDYVDMMTSGTNLLLLSSNEYVEKSLYFRSSGTSLSSPLALSGAANLFLKYPFLTPENIESIMKANGTKNTDDSACSKLGCGSGLIDMASVMSSIDNISKKLSYTKSHRYEGYNSESQGVWLKEMEEYSNVCNLVKYKWGKTGTFLDGITYKIFKSENGASFVYQETTTIPEKIYSHELEDIIGVQACINQVCGEMIQMKGDVNPPSSCI